MKATPWMNLIFAIFAALTLGGCGEFNEERREMNQQRREVEKTISEFRKTGKAQMAYASLRAIDRAVIRNEAKSLLQDRLKDAVIEHLDPHFDSDDAPYANLSPSPNAPYPSGTSPRDIKDPELRRDYTRRLEENREKSEYHNQQSSLRQFLIVIDARKDIFEQ